MSAGRRRWLMRLACLAALVAAPAKSAQGKDPAASAPKAAAEAPLPETLVEVSVLHGTHEAGDGQPGRVALPELREGPLASYESYRLLSSAKLSLSRGGKRKLRLPNGRLFEARLDEVLADGSSRLVASINRPGTRDFLSLLEVKARPGQAFFVAGQSYRHGMLVLWIKLLAPKPAR